jgi:hypothetical protein
MPSQRRVRVITYLVLAGIVTLLFLSQARHSDSLHDFHSKTVNALEKNHDVGRNPDGTAGQAGQKAIADHDVDADGDVDEDDALLAKQLADRLRQAEQKAKDNANAKGPNKPESPQEVVGVGSSASGQKKPAPKDKAEAQPAETEEDHEVEGVLNSILKKSPGITPPLCAGRAPLLTCLFFSHHLLQILLPLFQNGQRNPARQIYH